MAETQALKDRSKVILLRRRWSHHASPSGYDRLGDYVGQPLDVSPVRRWLLPNRLLWRLARGVIAYDRTGVALEFAVARHMTTHCDNVYHFLYGESTFKHAARLNGWRGHRIVASYHNPLQSFCELLQDVSHVPRLSAVVILGRTQFSIFEALLPPERIFFVPHGVNTTFFCPPAENSQRKTNLCLFVGHHLRDIETLNELIVLSGELAPQLKYVVITLPEYKQCFSRSSGNVEIRTALSDHSLVELYQMAGQLVIPLHDTVANNTVLEALACGLPIVVTDVGSIRDYVDDRCALLTPPRDARAMLAAILQVAGTPRLREEMSRSARNRALEFDWEVVAQQMTDVYRKVRNLPAVAG